MTELLPVFSRWAEPVGLLLVFGFALNLPFGWLREGTEKFSVPWFLYIHLPIPGLLLLRHLLGLGYWAIPFSLGAAVLAQLSGGRLRA